jgi:hypothetical protein
MSEDKWLLHLKNIFNRSIGAENHDLWESNIVQIDEKKVCDVLVKPSHRPVFIEEKEFYVRTNPATDLLEGKKLVEYVDTHFRGG